MNRQVRCMKCGGLNPLLADTCEHCEEMIDLENEVV